MLSLPTPEDRKDWQRDCWKGGYPVLRSQGFPKIIARSRAITVLHFIPCFGIFSMESLQNPIFRWWNVTFFVFIFKKNIYKKKCMALHDLPVVDDSIWHISGHTIDYGPLFWHKSIFSDIGVLCLLRALNLHQRVKPPSTGMWSKCYYPSLFIYFYIQRQFVFNCVILW